MFSSGARRRAVVACRVCGLCALSMDLKLVGPNEALRMRPLKVNCEPELLLSAPGQKFMASLLTLPRIRVRIFDALHSTIAF